MHVNESVCPVFADVTTDSIALKEVLPPSLIAALLVGMVIGAIVVVVVMHLLGRFSSSGHHESNC